MDGLAPVTPCAGLADLFFSTAARDVAAATVICSTCPHRTACAKLGTHEDFGVWGGIPRGPVNRPARIVLEPRAPGLRRSRPMKPECPAGHPYTDENTSTTYRANGSIKTRTCRICARERVQARRVA